MSKFQLEFLDPQEYRSKTRKSSVIIILIFALLGMGLASLLVSLLGTPGGNNFRWNLLGVLSGLILTVLLVKYYLSQQPFMREAVYGWHLKRSLMRITNVMHRIKPLAEAGSHQAMKLLRFYHLAVEEMHRLDGNEANPLEIKAEKKALEEKMQAEGLDLSQHTFDSQMLKDLSDREVTG
ncbi:Protein of unknown function [Marinospirillum celere]|uniref:DUF3087 domain-containing protein n=1 Tax=Marinospirillum celere TaxID=1122252 RepID=A0A1I1FFC7_9GAMM|nr:DUF3087 family protein [Marinospirillum celere]SFB97676.1 Protein of unknown function [Marinospirillum celere]